MVADGVVTVSGDKQHPANLGRLCSKGTALAETLDNEGRLLYPIVDGQRATWDEALNRVAEGFKKIIAEHGPDAVAFYVSGQLLTEDYYVANKLMKGFIGSANIDTNSRLCMSSAVAAHKRAFGADAVPVCYEDVEMADLVVLVGSNYAWAHPVLYQRLAAAKKARPEMQVVVIDPRRTATCDIADLHLAIAPGADAFLFNGLLHHLRREDAIDSRLCRGACGRIRRCVRGSEVGQLDSESGAGVRRGRIGCQRILPHVRENRTHRDGVLARHQPVFQRRGQGQRDHQCASWRPGGSARRAWGRSR